ncbi:SH3 domain and tetratricopeptide repeat-containing protein 2 isoform X4 [Ascaphus truei]|uniref:SH3 domain and tetratricopeptide repeat-containing protein 2 isoform X4 n=1 Tax=Ascaphus truei TaxID=8439 RepID=UPI003F59C6B5
MEDQGAKSIYSACRHHHHANIPPSWHCIYYAQREKIQKTRAYPKYSCWKSLHKQASEIVSSTGKGSVNTTDLGFLDSKSHRQDYSPNSQERCHKVKTMALDDPEDSELVSVAEEIPLGQDSVSLAVGEGFITEISLSFSILRRSTLGLNVALQEVARKTLWSLENDNKEVSLFFKELSARLVSIQAQSDLFVITFKTVEEIWKFTTYLSLGFVAYSLEHLLFDERHWLNSALVEDTEIQVSVNQDELATLYLGLLLQEGTFYARVVVHDCGGSEVEDGKPEVLKVSYNEVVQVKDIGDESSWEGQSLSTGERGLLPIIAVEPLPHPFYQWFLKTYPLSCTLSEQNSRHVTSQSIGQGLCTAREHHTAAGWDELSYCRGDTIEVVGYFVPGLMWFVGRCPSSGATGFVQTKHVDPKCLKALDTHLLFLSEEETLSLNSLDEDTQRGCVELLSNLSQTDISSVYRLDGLEPMEMSLKVSTGRICAKRMKLSQARVYFEEALSAMSQGFLDLHLLAALYGNLSAIYLKQKLKDKQEILLDKAATLLACLPQHHFSSENELEVLKYIFRKAIVVNNTSFEARICFLMFRFLHQLGRYDEALPFVERLQFLLNASCSRTLYSTIGVMPILSSLYDKKYLPHIALASARLCNTSSVSLVPSPLWKVGVVIENIYKIIGCTLKSRRVPAQAAPYLKHALSCSYESGDVKAQRTLCLILSKLYLQYGVLPGAICYSKRAVELGRWTSEEETFESSLFLGWMYILDGHLEHASQILRSLLESMQETDSITQCGVVHNLLSNAQKMGNKVLQASRGYSKALKMATETGNRRNQAIALANFGRVAVFCQALSMAERYFLKSVQLYIEVQGSDEAERELVQVLQWLGQIMVEENKYEYGKVCYELALLFALKSNNLKSQLKITEELCHFYSKVSPATGAHITYCEHGVRLVQLLKDRQKEGELLNTLSQLYQTLNTAKCFRKALDYTKQSLRISIDLGQHDKAAESWLQAGRLYYLLQEDELVEIYFHAAILASRKSEHLATILHLYEATGDVFFHGLRKRERALPFYKEGALPLAKKIHDIQTELRLFHKLTQLLISQGNYKKSLEFATMAVRHSTLVEDPLHELVAFHRLAGVYHSLQVYEVAEYCYLKALSLCSSPMQHVAEAGYYLKVYWRLGDIALLKRKDADDAATYLLLALAAAIEVGNKEHQLELRTKLANVYGKSLNDEEQADVFMQQTVQLSSNHECT